MIAKQFYPAILLTMIFAVFTGIVFPLLVWGLGQTLFPYQANGSLTTKEGKNIGSEIIGQAFHSARYFHSRPSAAGGGYDPLGSGGTNLGPTSQKLFSGFADDPQTANTDESYQGVTTLAKVYRETNGLAVNTPLPTDAVTRSGSGLDPHISPLNARLQTARVARERGMAITEVEVLVKETTENRFLTLFGEPRVNVLRLNLALDHLQNK